MPTMPPTVLLQSAPWACSQAQWPLGCTWFIWHPKQVHSCDQAAVSRPESVANGVCVQLTEPGKDKLEGTARVGRQQLWSPEFALGSRSELVQQLTWHLVHQDSCYLLKLSFSHKYSLVRLAVNGFVIMKKRPNMFSQVGHDAEDPLPEVECMSPRCMNPQNPKHAAKMQSVQGRPVLMV